MIEKISKISFNSLDVDIEKHRKEMQKKENEIKSAPGFQEMLNESIKNLQISSKDNR